MPSEIKTLLDQIEAEQLACHRGLSGLASGTSRHDFIEAKQRTIDEHHKRLIDLIGTEASGIVLEVLNNADMLYLIEQYRLEVRLLATKEGL